MQWDIQRINYSVASALINLSITLYWTHTGIPRFFESRLTVLTSPVIITFLKGLSEKRSNLSGARHQIGLHILLSSHCSTLRVYISLPCLVCL